jgi:hypothetical protein
MEFVFVLESVWTLRRKYPCLLLGIKPRFLDRRAHSVHIHGRIVEATCFSEMSVDFQETARRYISEGRTLQRTLSLMSPCEPEIYLNKM